jgi:hypothetical protein
VGEQHGNGRKCLDGEINGEGVFLKGGELGTRKDAESDDAGDEGLK